MGIFILIASILILVLVTIICQVKVNLSNPLSLLWGTWLISILICICNVFSVYPRLSIKSLFFIFSYLIITSLAFIIGHNLHFQPQITFYNGMRLLTAFNTLFLIVIAAYGITIIRLGLPPLFSGGVRSKYYLSGGGELLYLLIYPCFFLGLFMLYHRKAHYFHSYIIFQLLILTLIIISRGNKMAIFSVFLMVCFFWGRKVNVPAILVVAFLVVIIFSVISITYKRDVNDLNALKTAKISLTGFTLPNRFYFLYDPLIYMSSNINNIYTLMSSHLSAIGMGSLSFKGICQLLAIFNPSLAQLSSQSLLIANTSLTVPIFSTYSGLGELYFDFGPLIAIEIFMLIGFVNGILYNQKGLNLTSTYFGFILFQTLALSFFTFYLGNLEVITNLIVLFLVDMYARRSEGEQLGDAYYG